MKPENKFYLMVSLLAFILTSCQPSDDSSNPVSKAKKGGEDSSRVYSVARKWNEALMKAIRIDKPAPTIHSRNLYHLSAAMYDAWASYDDQASGVFYTQKNEAQNIAQARNMAISYAAYRILSHRYSLAADPEQSQDFFDEVMEGLNFDPDLTQTSCDEPACIGNKIAELIINETIDDGSNEENSYVDNTGYENLNPHMLVDYPSFKNPFPLPEFDLTLDANYWQQLFINSFTFQNGLVSGSNLQEYIGPHWGNVETFALGRSSSPHPYPWSDIDPGMPPMLNGVGDSEYREQTVELIRYSSYMDPDQGEGAELINISPRVNGNRPLGTHDNQGYEVNPVTGEAYEDQFVKRADYGRLLAEFWADGPDSETPPGHWNVLANYVSDHPLTEKRIEGTGDVVSDLEWDVKLYLALNGAAHDAAVAAWGTKRQYDYVRPITKIRYQGAKGQSTDPLLPSYDPDGLPLTEGLIELTTLTSLSPGGKHRNAFLNANRDHNGNFFENISLLDMVGKIVVKSWNHEPEDPETQVSGVDWILAENWVPYQRDNFVTPAFPAYVSGHSTFSRAMAEVLTMFTGSAYFPGGLGSYTMQKNDFLVFEIGPSETITLQWATYYDAADEAGISRLWGGIHVSPDDFQGRIMGSEIGKEAYNYARTFW